MNLSVELHVNLGVQVLHVRALVPQTLTQIETEHSFEHHSFINDIILKEISTMRSS